MPVITPPAMPRPAGSAPLASEKARSEPVTKSLRFSGVMVRHNQRLVRHRAATRGSDRYHGPGERNLHDPAAVAGGEDARHRALKRRHTRDLAGASVQGCARVGRPTIDQVAAAHDGAEIHWRDGRAHCPGDRRQRTGKSGGDLRDKDLRSSHAFGGRDRQVEHAACPADRSAGYSGQCHILPHPEPCPRKRFRSRKHPTSPPRSSHAGQAGPAQRSNR